MALRSLDLMIGDWVLHEGEAKQIVAIPSDNEVIFDGTLEKYVSDCVPILLTPEILEKNGFVLKDEDVGAFGVNIVPYYTRDDVPFEVFCDGEPFAIWFKDPVNIAFVHQLQHALKLCGIEKTIEL